MSASDYNFGSRLLHRLALGSKAIAQTSFDLETFFNRSFPNITYKRHVFVAGLARSGTTVVMRALYASGQFRSLTYRDMPFVLMPNLWKKISSQSKIYTYEKERAHGDRIMVDFDSPEAFEEAFWRIFCGEDYIKEDCLLPHGAGEAIIEHFRLFVRNVLASAADSHQTCYLSKNNNNLLRLPTIRASFPNAIIIIPFRDPLQHAISLLNQHKRFCTVHAENRFSLKYMQWLAHHEFGLTHKPPRFFNNSASNVCGSEDNINYWLRIWNSTYKYVLKKKWNDCIYVCYEELCSKSEQVLNKLFHTLSINIGDLNDFENLTAPPPKKYAGANQDLLNICYETYNELLRNT